MALTVSEIRVDFHGAGAGTAELTWGQMQVWRTVHETGRTMNIVTAAPLAEGTPLSEMVAFLRFMVSRHPALRSTLRNARGPSGPGHPGHPGHPCQVVAGSGSVPLQVVDIGDEDPAAVAEQLRARYELTWFDHEHEFPVRMGVVRQAGALRAIALGFSHVMVDGAGLVALTRDTELLDRATGEATAPPPPARDLLELAREQQGPAGRRQTGRCMRYWEAQLSRLGAWRNDQPADPQEPRFRELVAYSPAMELASRAVAARTRTLSSNALLAAYAVAVARVMGRNPSVVQIVVGNRFRPGFEQAVLQVSQPGICVVDAAAATFDEVVARAATAATSGSFYGYYDPVQRDRLLDEFAERMGGPLDISWHFNDRRALLATPDDGEAPTQAQAQAALRDALPRTRLYWDRAQAGFNGELFMQVDARPDPALVARNALDEGLPAVWIELWTDTHRFALEQIEAFVREMEAVLVEAAFDPAAPTRVG